MTAASGALRPPAGRGDSRERRIAAVALLLLAPLVGEFVGSSNAPAVLLPLLLPILALLYGPPALLIRELWVRRRIGAAGALLLGAAFGALNEAVVAQTWFDPFALQPKAHYSAHRAITHIYGRTHGVNVALAANLTVFHTFVSMFVPIVLLQVALSASRRSRYRQIASEPLLRRRGTIACVTVVLFVGASSVLGHRAAHGEMHRGPRAIALAGVIAASVLALALPRGRTSSGRAERVPAPGSVYAWGAAYSVSFFVLYFGAPQWLGTSAALVTAAFYGASVAWLWRFARSPAWMPRHALRLAAGVLTPAMLASVIRVAVLQPVVAGAFGWWLWRLDRQLGERSAAPP